MGRLRRQTPRHPGPSLWGAPPSVGAPPGSSTTVIRVPLRRGQPRLGCPLRTLPSPCGPPALSIPARVRQLGRSPRPPPRPHPPGGVTAVLPPPPHRVAEKETVNKMSLHNLATVFGPTLLRPSEKENKPPANPSQAISMTDSWSLEVMSQVRWPRLPGLDLWPLPAGPEPPCPGSGSHRAAQGRWPRSGDRAAAPPAALGWGSRDLPHLAVLLL